MIDRHRLLDDLKPILKAMESDLRARCDEEPQIQATLKAEYEQARAADRTLVTLEEWRADLITQVGVAWVLSCVFVRFLEDNALIAPPKISGPLHGAPEDAGLQRARDEREQYFRSHPKQTDRDYLLAVFDQLAKLPGAKDVFGTHNTALVPAYRNWLSGDAAQKLIEFFQKIDADGTGELIHDFTDELKGSQGGGWDTRFLGDLYQDLSEAARKKYALLQTPIFVEEFIIDRTLEPAIKEFGLKNFKLIDPACGSGHFLLGGFARLLHRWRQQAPALNDREHVNLALASVHGVDLNPFAIAIARFRLLIAVLRECRITKLSEAPAFTFNLACGDSLLHGSPGAEQQLLGFHDLAHVYQSEDLPDLQRILAPGTYHAVVANPPYITVKDKALNQAYRERYPEVCHRQYSLSVPFLQRLFVLACDGGFTGQITANSFMKREFGKKLIESYLPRIDLTHVIDTSGAYIPGHGTPTVILFGRNRKPVAPTIRAVMGIKGEPATPADPAHGLVWTAITQQIDVVGSQSVFVSVNDTPREQFGKHPWSIGGGGAAELKEHLGDIAASTLVELIDETGFAVISGEDNVLLLEADVPRRHSNSQTRPLADGEVIRNWTAETKLVALWPNDSHGNRLPTELVKAHRDFLWPYRTSLKERKAFGVPVEQKGIPWWALREVYPSKLRTPLSIAFGFVATHNHFVLDRGGKVFNRSAPVIKLPPTATDGDHLGLVGLLNSSTACFWMKQSFHDKGGGGINEGHRGDAWEFFFEFSGTGLQKFPLPAARPLALAKQLDALALHLSTLLPAAVVREAVPMAALLAERRQAFDDTLARMIALQEELDWQCYRLYGLLDEADGAAASASGASAASSSASASSLGASAASSSASASSRGASAAGSDNGLKPNQDTAAPPLALGQRAFEVILARKMAAGEEESTWFARHGSTPITEIPKTWPAGYRAVVQKRIELIEGNANIGLIERPEYKRRWNTEPWDEQQERAMKGWLLDRLEGYFDLDGRMNESKTVTAAADLREARLVSVAWTADLARADKDFMQVAEIYARRMDFDVAALVAELITAESVPALPVLRYKPSGMDKRTAWERTWDLQRLEDAFDAVFDIESLKSAAAGECERLLLAAVGGLAIDESAKEKVLHEAVRAASAVAEAVKQKLDLTADTILKPIHDAAKRAKTAVIGDIPVPPKYTSADFLSSNFWRLRGKLDVPKERWVSFPHCEGEDGSLTIAWAGYDHLQLARAIAERYELAKENEGRKLVPLLAAIGGLIPWLKQWHNEVDPKFGTRMGDYFEGYLAEEAKALGMSVELVMAWTPPEKAKRAGRIYTLDGSKATTQKSEK